MGFFHAHVHSSNQPPFDAHVHKVAAAVLTASNCRVFANYTSSKGVSMETVETPLDSPLIPRR